MRKFFSFFFGYGSSIVYIIVAAWLLAFQPMFESGVTAFRITYITLFFFLFSQAALVQVLKGQDEAKGMLDFAFSVIVFVGLILLAIFFATTKIIIWWDIYIMFMVGALYDLLINNRLILRMFRMSTGVASEG